MVNKKELPLLSKIFIEHDGIDAVSNNLMYCAVVLSCISIITLPIVIALLAKHCSVARFLAHSESTSESGSTHGIKENNSSDSLNDIVPPSSNEDPTNNEEDIVELQNLSCIEIAHNPYNDVKVVPKIPLINNYLDFYYNLGSKDKSLTTNQSSNIANSNCDINMINKWLFFVSLFNGILINTAWSSIAIFYVLHTLVEKQKIQFLDPSLLGGCLLWVVSCAAGFVGAVIFASLMGYTVYSVRYKMHNMQNQDENKHDVYSDALSDSSFFTPIGVLVNCVVATYSHIFHPKKTFKVIEGYGLVVSNCDVDNPQSHQMRCVPNTVIKSSDVCNIALDCVQK